MGAVAGTHKGTQTNLTVATVVVDANGVIVACSIDCAQNNFKIEDGEVVFTRLQTKKEIQFGYNMLGSSAIGKEWFEQAAAFEAWVIGKTGAEVAELLKKDNLVQSGTHWVTTDEDLAAGCTIDVQDFRDAVVKACNDEQGVTFTVDAGTEFALGLGINSANDGSACDDEENYRVKLNVEFAAAVVVDGAVVATVNDAYQPVITVEDDELVLVTVGTFEGNAEKNGVFMTKRELLETYGMKEAAIDKNGDGESYEWYVQSAIYSEHVIGKTAAELAGFFVADDDLLAAGCTIYIGGISTVVAEAVTNAR